MRRLTFVRVPNVSVTASSLPPMHAWPTPLKRGIIVVCAILCLIAYVALLAGIITLATLVLGLA